MLLHLVHLYRVIGVSLEILTVTSVIRHSLGRMDLLLCDTFDIESCEFLQCLNRPPASNHAYICHVSALQLCFLVREPRQVQHSNEKHTFEVEATPKA